MIVNKMFKIKSKKSSKEMVVQVLTGFYVDDN